MPKKKAPGKAEVEEVGKWFERIGYARKFREADGRKQAWINMKKYYRAMFDENVVSVPLLFSHGRQMIPMLYFQNPVVECTALWRGFEKQAKIQEAVDNMLLERMRVKDQLKLIIQDAYLYDYGIRKIGYDSEFGYDPTGSIWEDLFKELNIQLTEEEKTEYNTFIVREAPFFLRVPPSRFLIDPDVDGPGLETARWVVEEFYRPLEDVLEDDRYTIPKDGLRASHTLFWSENKLVISPKEKGYPSELRPHEYERLKMYEVWDKRDGRVRVMADGYDGYLREQNDEWGLENFFPYDKLCFNPVSDEHYSVSDAMYVERQQVEFNDIRTQEMKHRRKENIKIIYKKGVFTESQIQALESGDVGPLIEAATSGALGDSVMVLTPNMSRDIFMAANDVRGDFREVLAFGQNQLGQEMGRRKTASEAMIINQFVQLRGDERRDIIADFVTRAIKDVNRLVYEFWDTEEVIKIIGPEGEDWQTWNGESLKGEYAIRILANSSLPMNKELYKSQIRELYSMLAQHPLVNQKELLRLLLNSYEEFDTNQILLQDPNYNQPLIDLRPGKGKRGEEEGSRINMPENPEQAMASHQMGAEADKSANLQL